MDEVIGESIVSVDIRPVATHFCLYIQLNVETQSELTANDFI